MTILTLLRRYGQLAAVLALAGWVMLACHQRDQANIARGRMAEQQLQLQAHLTVLALKDHQDSLRGDSLSRLVRSDTVRLAKWLTRWDTVTTSTDIHDTVAVARGFATADSTIRSCRATVTDLLSSCAQKDVQLATKDSIIAVLRAVPAIPPRDRRFSLSVTAGYGATLTHGQVVTGPSTTLGGTWRIF